MGKKKKFKPNGFQSCVLWIYQWAQRKKLVGEQPPKLAVLFELICQEAKLEIPPELQKNREIVLWLIRQPQLSEPVFVRKPSKKSKQEKQFKDFYWSFEWRKLRYTILKQRGARCECCGNSAQTGAVINVDHIKPIRHFWELRLEPTNLQILCNECNHGKGSWDTTSWAEETQTTQH